MPEGERLKAFYPGLPAHEATLWRRFLREHERDFHRFEYNVRVGQGSPLTHTPPPGGAEDEASYRRMWLQLTQRRIDVVAWRQDETWLIEIEPRPSARAVGQLAMYEQLYTDQWPDTGYVQIAVIANALSPDVARILESMGAVVFLYPEPTAEPSAA